MKKIIIATKGEQHIKVQKGIEYRIALNQGGLLITDFENIAKKVDDDLKILLKNDTIVILDDYFLVCESNDCSILLPSNEGLQPIKNTFVTLADGSQIVHQYGDKEQLLNILDSQPSTFIDSFSDAYFSKIAEAGSYFKITTLLGMAGAAVTVSGGTSPEQDPLADTGIIFIGDATDEIIAGSAGDDILKGRDGNDLIVGGGGNDIMTGGSGKDIFKYESADAQGVDTITDFEIGVDKLDLSLFHVMGFVPYFAFENNDEDTMIYLSPPSPVNPIMPNAEPATIILTNVSRFEFQDMDTMIADGNILW